MTYFYFHLVLIVVTTTTSTTVTTRPTANSPNPGVYEHHPHHPENQFLNTHHHSRFSGLHWLSQAGLLSQILSTKSIS